MRTVDDFAAIRPAHRDGLRIRQIARRLAVGRGTVRKALNKPEPRPHTLSRPRPAPTFGPFRGFVDAILAQDETAPRKQRHTASQVFRRCASAVGADAGVADVLARGAFGPGPLQSAPARRAGAPGRSTVALRARARAA